MPIANYSVLCGRPVSGKVVSGSSAHYDISVDAGGASYTVAVNIESVDGSEVLYTICENFVPPAPNGLLALSEGVSPLVSQPGGLALDYVRSTVQGAPMITRAELSALPIAAVPGRFMEEALSLSRRSGEFQSSEAESHALQNAVVTLLNRAVADSGSRIYALGSAYADSGTVDGIHDIHMNQGNPVGNHGDDNGTWQDGALFVQFSGQSTWTALFIAFQTESWTTDKAGDPTKR